MKWDLVLERLTLNKLNNDITRKTLRHIAKAAERNRSMGFIAKVGRIEEPVVTTDPADTQEKYRYLVRLRLEDHKSRTQETSREKFRHVVKVVEKCANSRSWTLVDETKPTPTSAAAVDVITPLLSRVLPVRQSFTPPKLTPEVMQAAFPGIYERDAHVRLIHDSVELFVDSNRQKRSHTLLWGKPAGAKTTVFLALKEWYEQESHTERVAILDGTTLTKAGLERWILDRAEDGTLPEIICLEEIEKHQTENLLSLLSVMDSRGMLQRCNARDGQVKANVRVLVWATCNDRALLEGFKNGALWSRFTHKHECLRPTRELMRKILMREIQSMNGGKPEWADAALSFGCDEMKTDDPREIIGLLDGRDRLISGEYQNDKRQVMNLQVH